MSDKDLTLDSEDSDEEYFPEDDSAQLSEEVNSDPDNVSGSDNDAESPKKKTKKRSRKRRTQVEESAEKQDEPNDKKPKRNIDDIWADFKKDVINDKKSQEKESVVEVRPSSILPKLPVVEATKANPVKTQKCGLSSLLGQIGKKSKISTLEKSKLDWENFKKNEGISEDLETFNKGKDGYLERQDFLQRTDLRRFEIEKQLRSTSKRH